MNTVNNQAADETIFQHVTPLSLTQEELLEVLHPIFERNYEIIKKRRNLSKKEFILQTVVKHYLMTSSK